MKCYYVYVFLDPRKPGKFIYEDLEFDYEPFYIGKGCDDRIYVSKYDRGDSYKVRKIRGINESGLEIISKKLVDNLSNEESLEVEKSLIKKIGRRNLELGPLTNLTDGGEGRLTSPHSEDTKKKISNTKKSQNLHSVISEKQREILRNINQGEKNPMFGKTHTEEVKRKHSDLVSGFNHPMFGKKHDKSTRRKIAENRRKSISQEEINQISAEFNSKSVLQYDLEGNFIQQFKSVKEASQILGLSESLIGKTCRGVIKKPRKFIFKFKNPEDLTMRNSYVIKEGDSMIIGDIQYILVKRNNRTAIVRMGNDLITLKYRDCPILVEKRKIIS